MSDTDPREISQKEQHLQKVPAFANLPKKSIEQIALRLDVRKAVPGSVILHRDDAVQELYYIFQGEVEVLVAEEVETVLYGGDSFGDEILQAEEYLSQATFRARETTIYYALGRRAFWEARRQDPSSDQVTIYPRHGWQKPGERVIFVSPRRVGSRMLRFLLLASVAASMISCLIGLLSARFLLSMEVSFIVLESLILYLAWQRSGDWENWSYVLTNTRIVEHRAHGSTTLDEPYTHVPLRYIEAIVPSRHSLQVKLRPPGKSITLSNLAEAKRFALATAEAIDHVHFFEESERAGFIENLLIGRYPGEGVTDRITQWRPHWLPFVLKLVWIMIIMMTGLFVLPVLYQILLAQSASSPGMNIVLSLLAGSVLMLLGQWQLLVWRGRSYLLSPTDVSRKDSKWDFLNLDYLSLNRIQLDDISAISLEIGLGKHVLERTRRWRSPRWGSALSSLLRGLNETLDVGSVVFERQSDYGYGQRLLFADVSNPRKVYFEVLGAVYDRMELQWLERNSPMTKAMGRLLRPLLEAKATNHGESLLAPSDFLKVLVVIPYPTMEEGKHVRALQVEAEWRRIADAMKEEPALVHVTRVRPPTLDKLKVTSTQARDSGQPYDVVHIIGHGSRQGVQFENEFGELHSVTGMELGVTMRDLDVALVVLNLCNSLPIAGNLMCFRAARSVLCTRHPMDEEVSISLAQNLYGSLSRGKSVQEAVDETKRKIAGKFGDSKAKALELLVHPQASSSPLHLSIPVQTRSLRLKEDECFKVEEGLPKVYDLPECKLTREPILADMVRDLENLQCQAVHLHGGNQRKRTDLACETGARLCWKFQGGVAYLDCEQITNFNDIGAEIHARFTEKAPAPWNEDLKEATLDSLPRVLVLYSWSQGPILLILDRLDNISSNDKQRVEFEKFLDQLAPGLRNKVIVTTRHDVKEWSPNQGVFKLRVNN